MLLVWDENAWEDYLCEGIGKPDALKHDFAGYWSRRITDEHRLVHKVVDDEVRIAACRYHYG
ncbi:MAG: Txe/YoeB family addiction module toxin [Dermatophilaceae bacterium]